MMDGAPTGGPGWINCWLQSFNYLSDLISSLQSVLLDNKNMDALIDSILACGFLTTVHAAQSPQLNVGTVHFWKLLMY